ncbi:hypothetical protein FIBSPDRAFT_898788 [Athelia psychrophila]|uniref:Uncharacterized protein n=1 Tax=Athelia psychrophila TaxID=1759441 RepID=A0A166AJ62_9AGAM|nr:hypothetical protein FIBSPDRAFT_898788 [Fibularhizoctonia sp. CBS 109695]
MAGYDHSSVCDTASNYECAVRDGHIHDLRRQTLGGPQSGKRRCTKDAPLVIGTGHPIVKRPSRFALDNDDDGHNDAGEAGEWTGCMEKDSPRTLQHQLQSWAVFAPPLHTTLPTTYIRAPTHFKNVQGANQVNSAPTQFVYDVE